MSNEEKTDQQNAADEEADKKDLPEFDNRPDSVLQYLVHVINRNDDMFLGVTLSVGGMLISGLLISRKRFFEELAKVYRMQVESQATNADEMEKIIASIGVPDDNDNESREDFDEAFSINSLHLAETRFFHHSGKPIPANRGVLWRGRLMAVDGFSLGTLSADPEPGDNTGGVE